MKKPIYYALLSVQSSLINAVTPQLRAVTVDIDDRLILRFFYDGEVTEELADVASLVGTEVNHPDYLNSEHILRLDFPQEVPIQGKLAFLRKEPVLPKFTRENRSFLLKEIPPLAVLRLDMQEALLGKVTPDLRWVVVGIDAEKKQLEFWFFYNGEITEEKRFLATAAIEEASVSFPGYERESHIERCDFDFRLPEIKDNKEVHAAYLRREYIY